MKNKSYIPLLILVLVIGSIVVVDLYKVEQKESVTETNYVGLVYLGLSPSTYSREVTERDYDTGIKFGDGDNVYSLIESRSLEKGDIGKTFIVRIR